MTNNNNKVIIITGNKGEGKTTKLVSIINSLRASDINIIGFTATALWSNGERNKYLLNDAVSNKSITLCTGVPVDGYSKYGRFFFNPKAIEFGEKLISSSAKKESLIIIDEVGPFEINNQIWHSSLLNQLETTNNTLLITVRKSLVDNVITKYNLKNVLIFNINDPDKNIINNIIPFQQ